MSHLRDYSFASLPKITLLGDGVESLSTSLAEHDATLLIFHNLNTLKNHPALAHCSASLLQLQELDEGLGKAASLHFVSGLGGSGRLIIAGTGPLDRDYDDVRRYCDAVKGAMARLRQAGLANKKAILLIQAPPSKLAAGYEEWFSASVLQALLEVHDPLEAREFLPADKLNQVTALSFAALAGGEEGTCGATASPELASLLAALETGRRLARDLGAADPERMSPPNCAHALQQYFAPLAPRIGVEVIADQAVLQREYPLLWAVARGTQGVARHAPRVVKLSYRSPRPEAVEEELFLVGKGICFDTGGHDLKTGGNMTAMSRDKCGAAAFAGFMATVAQLAPDHLNIECALAFVRNEIGPEAYVCDEIIRSRAGVRVRVVNTDAEGRMVMADLLAEMRERALQLPQPGKARLLTCATLTGHAARTYGRYGAVMENGPAKQAGLAARLQQTGQQLGDILEISNIRRDDWNNVDGKDLRYDIVQSHVGASGPAPRGHQFPFAFMARAAGLDAHGQYSERPLSYLHLDIAGSAEEAPAAPGGLGRPTATPILALSAFLKRLPK